MESLQDWGNYRITLQNSRYLKYFVITYNEELVYLAEQIKNVNLLLNNTMAYVLSGTGVPALVS